MIYAVNYSDLNFKAKQKLNTNSALKNGFKKVFEYGPEDLDLDFKKKNEVILKEKRGGGYWIWKPYIILKSLEKISEGDYLFYCDSGAIFLKNPMELIDYMEKNKLDILPFELPLLEKQWTKRETFEILDCKTKKYMNSNQILATYFILKKTDFTVKFFKEFLDKVQDEKLVTDIKYMTQYKEFIDHRHDQSIFSLLCKKYEIIPFVEPTQYGDHPWLYNQHKKFIFIESNVNRIHSKKIILSLRKSSLIRMKIRIFILDIFGESIFNNLRQFKEILK